MTPEDFATPEDIHAARPDVPTDTIRRRMRSGMIPGAVKLGRSWVVPVSVAEEFAETYQPYTRKSAGPDAHPPVTSGPTDPPQE